MDGVFLLLLERGWLIQKCLDIILQDQTGFQGQDASFILGLKTILTRKNTFGQSLE